MKSITILGSTGSIGTQALEVIREHPGELKVSGLACLNNVDLLRRQVEEFKPDAVAVFDKDVADKAESMLDIQVFSGMDGLLKLSKMSGSDTVLNSLVGSIGIRPTVEAIKAGKDIALANKETLVAAGKPVMELVKKHGVAMKPIDSEHSAIFQCIQCGNPIKRLILTCSGGAFRDKTVEEMKTLKAKDALKHPNWDMGRKVTVDSATLMNKGFEVIEAHMLFGVDYDNIDVVIHPQSVVHSLVEFEDTSLLAQLGWPSMKIPIQYALSHPKRLKAGFNSLSLAEIKRLDFSAPDLRRFPCLAYAYEAGRLGGSMPCVMNAANEIAVKRFLQGEIAFLDIPRMIREAMDNHKPIKNPDIDEILEIDTSVKEAAV